MKNYLRRAPTLREIILSQVPFAIYANRFRQPMVGQSVIKFKYKNL